jgi:hypothetical protein
VALQARVFDKIPDRLLYSLLAWQYRSFDGELRHLGDYFPRDAAKTGTVVDVGAWWGPWTYWLSRKADTSSRSSPCRISRRSCAASLPTTST